MMMIIIQIMAVTPLGQWSHWISAKWQFLRSLKTNQRYFGNTFTYWCCSHINFWSKGKFPTSWYMHWYIGYQTIELKIFLYTKKPFDQILVHEKRLIHKKSQCFDWKSLKTSQVGCFSWIHGVHQCLEYLEDLRPWVLNTCFTWLRFLFLLGRKSTFSSVGHRYFFYPLVLF